MPISKRHRHYFFLAVALVLATFVAALGGTSFQRKAETFQPLGFEARKQQGAWLVTAVSHPRTGIRPDDAIYSIAEDFPATLGELRERLRASETSALLLERDGDLETVSYTRPPLEVDFPYLILAAIGAVYLLIGLYTAFKDRQLHARVFYLWCLASLSLYVMSPPRVLLDFTDELIFLFDQLARALVPALTLHLFLVFPRQLFGSRWLRLVIPLVYLPSLLSISFHVDQIYGEGRLFGPVSASRIQLVYKLELFFLVASALIAALTLFVRFAQKPNWESRRQVQWIFLGLIGGYVPFLAFAVLPWALDFSWPNWTTILGVLPLGLVPLAFAWAILKYKLLDIGIVLRDSISYSLTVLIGLFGFSLINVAIRNGVAEDLSLARNFLTFAAGVVIAGALAPTRGVISSSLERLRFRESYEPRRDLASLGQELLHERDLDRLCDILIDRLADGLVVRVHLYLAQGGAMVPVEVRGGLPLRGASGELPRELSFDAFGEQFWRRDVESISAVHFPEEEATAEQRLFLAGYRYVFPLRVRDERIGVALLSYKFDDEPLISEDLDLARGLLNQASLAIENAQLLEEVHRRLLDVTRLEERNQGILESSPAGIAVLGGSQRVISANHAFAVIADRARPDVVGKTIEELIHVGPLPAPGEDMLEVSFCRLSGEERHLQLSVANYSREEGQPLKVLVIQDISERIRIEQELREKERLASLGLLAAGVAHEVNTPLTGISSYAQLLMSEVDESDPHHAILKKLERQSFRAAQIVNNLLEFARNRRDELSPVQLDSVLDECVQLLTERAEETSVEICWRRPKEPLPVFGHEGELHQVFTNLMVNALDAMSSSGGRLTLTAENGDTRIRVTVSDTGPGIPAERLDRIFQPFFSSKLSKGGSGLGLAITSNIVRRHAGEIRVENHQDRSGCRFLVELPRHVA